MKGFQVQEFRFDEAVKAFDIGMGIGGGRGNEAMGCARGANDRREAREAFRFFLAAKFSAVIGRHGEAIQGEALIAEVKQDPFDRERRIGGREFIRIIDEHRTAFDVS